MTKPTPGPYRVEAWPAQGVYVVLTGDGKPIATFPTSIIEGGHLRFDEEQALANARAWVEGREAMEELDRIRSVVAGYDADKFSDAAAFFQIKDILDEAKP